MKILLAVPTLSTVHAEFFTSVVALRREVETVLMVAKGSLVYDARNYIVNTANESNCDYIMWMDSDMIFPPDTLSMLLNDGLDFVSGLYFSRRFPVVPVIAKKLTWEQDQVTGRTKHSVEVYEDYPKNELFEIEGSGFGCVLTKTEMCNNIAKTYGMSPFEPIPGLGEDYSFCYKARDIGYKLFCDSRIKCGHIGEYIFDENVYLSSKGGNNVHQ